MAAGVLAAPHCGCPDVHRVRATSMPLVHLSAQLLGNNDKALVAVARQSAAAELCLCPLQGIQGLVVPVAIAGTDGCPGDRAALWRR